MGRPCAVVGIGQTKYRRQAAEQSLEGLVREAALKALDDAGMTFADIDAIVIGKAPDALEGVMMPELSLADALGAVGKPIHRVHTAGSVGASTAVTGAIMVESGRYDRVLVVCYEKQSEGNATWALSGGRSGGQGAGGTFAPWIRSYISRSGAPEHIGWQVAVKDRLNALKNPNAHLHIADISIEKVKESPMLWDPLHFLESCPVVGRRGRDRARQRGGRRRRRRRSRRGSSPTPSAPSSARSPGGTRCGRRPASTARRSSTARPASPTRSVRSTAPRSTSRSSWYEPMWLEGHDIAPIGEGWKLTDSGATELDGSFPVNPSGGVLSSNPIGASGLIRCLEAANQVRGTAGEYQVDGAKVALGHAYGGAAQYFAMWIVSSEMNPTFT